MNHWSPITKNGSDLSFQWSINVHSKNPCSIPTKTYKIEVLVPTNHDRVKKILDFCGGFPIFCHQNISVWDIFIYFPLRCLSHSESPEEKEKARALKGEADYLEPWRTGATEVVITVGRLYPRAVNGSNLVVTSYQPPADYYSLIMLNWMCIPDKWFTSHIYPINLTYPRGIFHIGASRTDAWENNSRSSAEN